MRPRTLKVLAAFVALLATLVAFDRERSPGETVRNRIFPGFTPEAVAWLSLHADERPELLLVREGSELRLEAPGRWPTDPAQVRSLLGTLELLSFRRRVAAGGPVEAAARGLDRPRLVVTMSLADGRKLALRVGKPEPILGQVWIAVEGQDHVFLVDEYAGRALDRPADDLRRRDLLPIAPAEAERIELSDQASGTHLVLSGHPRCVETSTGRSRADANRAQELETQLADLRASWFRPSGASSFVAHGGPFVRFRVDEHEVTIGDACPGADDERQVEAWLGPACVRTDLVARIVASLGAPADWVERTLIPLTPGAAERVEVARAGLSLVLERHAGTWRTTNGSLDESTVRTWLEELTSLRALDVVASPVVTVSDDAPRITVSTSAETVTVWLERRPRGQLLARRPGEPWALRMPSDAVHFFVPDPLTFHDGSVLRFDAYALAAVSSGSDEAIRGVTASDWKLASGAPADAEAVFDLRERASDLRAVRVVASEAAPEHGFGAPAHRLTFVVDPPPSAPGAAPERLSLEIGKSLRDGTCFARRVGVEGVFLLLADDCRALSASFRAHH